MAASALTTSVAAAAHAALASEHTPARDALPGHHGRMAAQSTRLSPTQLLGREEGNAVAARFCGAGNAARPYGKAGKCSPIFLLLSSCLPPETGVSVFPLAAVPGFLRGPRGSIASPACADHIRFLMASFGAKVLGVFPSDGLTSGKPIDHATLLVNGGLVYIFDSSS